MKIPTEPAVQREKILRLNVFQTWLIIIATVIGIVGAVTAWASGWLGLPEKVKATEEALKPLALITNRVESVEQTTRLMWQKMNADHDLLIKIDQKLTDQGEQTRELRDDVKLLKK